jgi:hypothetical protein
MTFVLTFRDVVVLVLLFTGAVLFLLTKLLRLWDK